MICGNICEIYRVLQGFLLGNHFRFPFVKRFFSKLFSRHYYELGMKLCTCFQRNTSYKGYIPFIRRPNESVTNIAKHSESTKRSLYLTGVLVCLLCINRLTLQALLAAISQYLCWINNRHVHFTFILASFLQFSKQNSRVNILFKTKMVQYLVFH